jgi:hypothetical protein
MDEDTKKKVMVAQPKKDLRKTNKWYLENQLYFGYIGCRYQSSYILKVNS